MSRNGRNSMLELKLKLSPPGGSRSWSPRRMGNGSPHLSSSSSSSSPRSCVSSDPESSPEPASMVLAGCPRCLMYVMLSDKDPRCPKCKSAVLLNLSNQAANKCPEKTKIRRE